MPDRKQPEPWLRGTLNGEPPVSRAVLHALELAGEDLDFFCAELTDAEFNKSPHGLPPVAFHLRHIARSLDRLLSYAEGNSLRPEQRAALKSEFEPGATRDELFREFHAALTRSAARIRALDGATLDAVTLDQKRVVGSKQLPTTVAGLLVHVADHTQRHVGQAITTAKVVVAQRP